MDARFKPVALTCDEELPLADEAEENAAPETANTELGAAKSDAKSELSSALDGTGEINTRDTATELNATRDTASEMSETDSIGTFR